MRTILTSQVIHDSTGSLIYIVSEHIAGGSLDAFRNGFPGSRVPLPTLRSPATRAVMLLHPPVPLVGVSIAMERERRQNDSLVNDY